MDVEVGAAQPAPVDVPDLEDDRRVGAVCDRSAVVRIHVFADHQPGELRGVHLRHRQGGHQSSAAQNRHAIGQLEDLVQAVRDVDHAGAGAAHLAHELEEALDFVVREHRGRLVEDEEAAPPVPSLQRSGDGDHGALDGCRLAQGAVDVELHAEAREHASRLHRLLPPMHASASRTPVAASQRQVLHRAQLEHEAEVLVHEPESLVDLAAVAEVHGLAVEHGARSGVGVVVAGENLDQRRLARPVRADQRVDLIGAHVERHIDQGPCAGKRLREVLELE